MASIDEKEENDAFNSRIEEKRPSTTQRGANTSPSGHQQQFQCEKSLTSSEQVQGKGTSQDYRAPNIQQDAMENVFQMAITMMELKKEEEILKYKK
ncbi:hypothetical protein O181_042672 [Austropuccinia psidii MF-1]|uniref:Uncharacterized protein n=1 Tax=Austropuccinia psidii MF-1 TaxID=1389203 RepID=A0A9Q3DJ27_9BASI|nr:hypothetical protein [Austropuccinia psidii MF-1]